MNGTRALTAVLAVALLTSCSQSTLSQDDQAFCSAQGDDPLAYLRDQVDQMLQDGGHWQDKGEAFAFQTVVVHRSQSFLDHNFQDQHLKDLATNLDSSLSDAMVAADEGEFMDTGVLRKLQGDLRALGDFCDKNG